MSNPDTWEYGAALLTAGDVVEEEIPTVVTDSVDLQGAVGGAHGRR